MANRTFHSSVGLKIEKQYSTVVKPMHGASSRGGCMAAVYNGAITALYGEKFAKNLWKAVIRESRTREKANNVDLIMEKLQRHGCAGGPWKFRYRSKKLQCESPHEYVGKGAEEAINKSLIGSTAGWYFFGASVSRGYHSVVLGIQNQATGCKIYWLDQFSKGLKQRRSSYATPTTEVTGKLDESLTNVGTNRTKLWPLYVAVPLREIGESLSRNSQQQSVLSPTVLARQTNGLMTRGVGRRGSINSARGPLGRQV